MKEWPVKADKGDKDDDREKEKEKDVDHRGDLQGDFGSCDRDRTRDRKRAQKEKIGRRDDAQDLADDQKDRLKEKSKDKEKDATLKFPKYKYFRGRANGRIDEAAIYTVEGVHLGWALTPTGSKLPSGCKSCRRSNSLDYRMD